jgi:predicted RNase H-like HicB family nuclease
MTDGNYCYVAFHPELPNVISQGISPEEAKANLIETTELTIAHLVSNNLPIPESRSFKSTNFSSLSTESSDLTSNNLFTSIDESSGDPSNGNQEVRTLPSGQLQPL